MRYAKGHKEATRQRIVEAAATRFRQEGIDAVGVANLMAGVGLTQGGFYNHFESKDDLARASIAAAWRDALARLDESLEQAGDRALETLVDRYLSAAHRDHPGSGCTAAALAPEVARGSLAVREAFTEGLRRFADLIAAALPAGLKPKQRRERALAVMAAMAGALALARAAADPGLSDALLAAGRQAALALGRAGA
jgi:TetR/AcrR family transcriptional repressor of nem operon